MSSAAGALEEVGCLRDAALSLVEASDIFTAARLSHYVTATAVWLLSVVPHRAVGNLRAAILFAVAGPFQWFLLGTAPIGEWFRPDVMIALFVVGAASMLALFGWAVLRRRTRVRATGVASGWRSSAYNPPGALGSRISPPVAPPAGPS